MTITQALKENKGAFLPMQPYIRIVEPMLRPDEQVLYAKEHNTVALPDRYGEVPCNFGNLKGKACALFVVTSQRVICCHKSSQADFCFQVPCNPAPVVEQRLNGSWGCLRITGERDVIVLDGHVRNFEKIRRLITQAASTAQRAVPTCPYCGSAITHTDGSPTCPHCGGMLDASTLPVPGNPEPAASGGFCTQCGKPLGTAARFCASCGHPVGQAQPPIPQPIQVSINYEHTRRYTQTVQCSRCASRDITVEKRGYSWISGLIWCCLLPPIGLLFGFIGSGKLYYRCHGCGRKVLKR